MIPTRKVSVSIYRKEVEQGKSTGPHCNLFGLEKTDTWVWLAKRAKSREGADSRRVGLNSHSAVTARAKHSRNFQRLTVGIKGVHKSSWSQGWMARCRI